MLFIKASRASSRNSFASEDLERYMQPNKPVPPPRVTPVNTRQPSGTNRILSGRSQDSAFPHIYETPPPVKPRKLSTSKSNSYTNMNVENEDSMHIRAFFDLDKIKFSFLKLRSKPS